MYSLGDMCMQCLFVVELRDKARKKPILDWFISCSANNLFALPLDPLNQVRSVLGQVERGIDYAEDSNYHLFLRLACRLFSRHHPCFVLLIVNVCFSLSDSVCRRYAIIVLLFWP